MKLFEKKKKRESSLANSAQNPYYEKISERLGILQVVLYLSLFAFVVLSFLGNTQLITYRNFYYFFKDLNASAETVLSNGANTLSYPTAPKQSFTLYRNGLSVVSDTNVTIFTASGRQTVSKSVSFQNATAVGSGKYLLVYELGGTKYALFNSYTQIFEGNTEYPISNASVSDSGAFALVSSAQSYTSVVSFYNDSFELVNRYNKNGYVLDVAIDPKGETIVIAATDASNGRFLSELSISKRGENAVSQTVLLNDACVWSCDFTDDDRIAVLHSDGLNFYNLSGRELQSHSFKGYTVVCASVSTDGAVFALTENEAPEKTHLRVFNENGRLLYDAPTENGITQLSMREDRVYGLAASGILLVIPQSEKQILHACDTANKQVIAVGNREVLLCSPQKAEYITVHE